MEGAVGASTGASSESRPRDQTPSGTQGVPKATVGVSSAGEAAGSSEGPFVADPEANGGSGYQADTVLGLRYGLHEGYERLVVDLGTGAEPAQNVQRWTLSNLRGDGLLRVNLPSASATEVSEGRLGGRLVRSFHVVRAPEGGMFVNFCARSSFHYRVIEVGNPARLVVDFKPAGAPLEVPSPARGPKRKIRPKYR